jgi:hypothetical protein
MSMAATAGLRCRRVADVDLPAAAQLLSRGFRLRPERYWLHGHKRQADRQRPERNPPYGYLVEHAGTPVSVVLLFYSSALSDAGGDPALQFVELVSRAVIQELRLVAHFVRHKGQERYLFQCFTGAPDMANCRSAGLLHVLSLRDVHILGAEPAG